MGNPTPEILGLITALVFVGGFAGALVVAYPADKFGRRPTIQFGSLLCIIGSVLQSAAPNRNVFIGGRFILGFGISFTTCAGPSLLNELSHPRLRGKMASMVRMKLFRYHYGLLTCYKLVQRPVVCGINNCLVAFIRYWAPRQQLVLENPIHRADLLSVICHDCCDLHARVTSLALLKGSL